MAYAYDTCVETIDDASFSLKYLQAHILLLLIFERRRQISIYSVIYYCFFL